MTVTSTSIVWPRLPITLQEMAKAVVLLFLLDSLPDFNNVINTTLHKFAPGLIGVICDATLTAPVLEVIGKKLNLSADSMENLQNIDTPNSYNNYKFQELTPDSLSNVGLHYNSYHESYEFSAEKSGPNFIGHNYIENENKDNVSVLVNATGNSFTESAPFLAAIFESVGNITAQTCGGVLLSKYWVLTAASCLNVLGPIYRNSTNETFDNSYSIVMGAKNPLRDGSVHQVSKIYLHPSPNGLNHSNVHQDLMKNWFNSLVGPEPNVTAPSLALLRIQPGVEGVLPMTVNSAWAGDATLYGWTLEKHDFGFVTSATTLPTKQLSPAECKKSYGIPENNAMCLLVNETSSDTTRINSGCPLVVHQHGRPTLLALALSDGTRPLLATPLSEHLDWLQRLTVYGK